MKKKTLEFARQPDFRNLIKNTYKKTIVYQVDKLLEKEKYYKNKMSYAEKNLLAVRKKINKLMIELAHKEIKPNG